MYTNTLIQLTNAPTTLQSVPGGATPVLVSDLGLANITGADCTVDVWIERAGTSYYLIKAGALPGGSRLNLAERTIVLQASDVLRASCSTARAVDVSVSAKAT